MSEEDLRDFLVRRDKLSEVQWAAAQTQRDQPLAAGEALLRVDRYALTANNITYGFMGELMRYWEFFPAPADWGRIPVWGHADVIASRVPELAEGERIYGYLPMSTLLRVRPEQITPLTFSDGSEHRRALPMIYQQYSRGPRHEPQREDVRAVLQPLFGTGFLIDDWLIDNALFGARQVVLGSASSKTALSTAYMLSRRPERQFEIVGLTSAKNRSFCERVKYYDRVVEYGALAGLSATTPTVFVDMAGDGAVLRDVHQTFGDALRYSCIVGATHRTALSEPPKGLPGPAPQLFFAPTVIEKRRKDWGAEGFARRLKEAQDQFYPSAQTWLELVHGRGPEAIEATYRRVLDGQTEPHQGMILSP